MKIDVLTIFPGMFKAVLGDSIIKRAIEKKKLKVNLIDLRKFTHDNHRSVDDRPFGGGPGMVMKAEPIFEAIDSLKLSKETRIVLLTAQGKVFNQARARKLSKLKHLVLIIPHYEGIDERVRANLVTDEISIGDYILTGGELPAMVLIDSVTRLLPGVLGHDESNKDESFSHGLLEYPHYTRPSEYQGMKTPEVLLSGDHKKIERWRKDMALKRTKKRRPDLLKEETP